jgi:4a-hydroxytetrahydrobiopterin dehydratase
MKTDLVNKSCKPCEGGVDPLTRDEAEKLLEQLDDAWSISGDGKTISRRFEFEAYSRTLAFANAAAWIAVVEGHHPELVVNYGTCDVSYSTHAVDGLTDNDFICAAKTDRLVSDA